MVTRGWVPCFRAERLSSNLLHVNPDSGSNLSDANSELAKIRAANKRYRGPLSERQRSSLQPKIWAWPGRSPTQMGAIQKKHGPRDLHLPGLPEHGRLLEPPARQGDMTAAAFGGFGWVDLRLCRSCSFRGISSVLLGQLFVEAVIGSFATPHLAHFTTISSHFCRARMSSGSLESSQLADFPSEHKPKQDQNQRCLCF